MPLLLLCAANSPSTPQRNSSAIKSGSESSSGTQAICRRLGRSTQNQKIYQFDATAREEEEEFCNRWAYKI